eukprot:Em0012g966a
MSRVSTQSSYSGNSQAPASPACTEHSESSQVPYSLICTSSSSLVLAQESDMEPYSSRVPVSLGNLRPASDPATLITPIRQDAPTHSTSCSSSHVSVPQVSYVMDSPELPHSSTQHPVQSITPQGFETGPEPARSSQSPASSTISSPLHTPIFSHAHSPSTLTTGVPYEEALLCTTPSSSGHNTRGRKPCIVEGCREHIAPSMWRNHMNAHAKGIFAGSVPTGWLEENGLYKCEQCSQLVAKSHSNSHLQNPIVLPASEATENNIVPLDFDIQSVLRSFPKASACGPSGLRIQHLLDASEVPLPTVLQKLVGTIATDEVSSHLLYHKWYMDDGAVAGSEKAVARVITILSELGPQLGLFLNVSKCERAKANVLLSRLQQVGSKDPQLMPTPHKNLHLDPPEFQMALKWWLGLDTSQNGSSCSFCPSHALDPLGHHALTCKSGGDSIFRHNSLRDTFWESCKLACIAGQIEAGSGLDVEGSRTRPADILLPNWEFGKPAALDFTITSALNPSTLNEASVMAGFAASAAEIRKHVANDEKCSRLGWVCIPLSVETYGCWGEEAGRCLDRLATRIATRTGCPKSSAVSGLYGRLSIGLIRANARALLARSSSLS